MRSISGFSTELTSTERIDPDPDVSRCGCSCSTELSPLRPSGKADLSLISLLLACCTCVSSRSSCALCATSASHFCLLSASLLSLSCASSASSRFRSSPIRCTSTGETSWLAMVPLHISISVLSVSSSLWRVVRDVSALATRSVILSQYSSSLAACFSNLAVSERRFSFHVCAACSGVSPVVSPSSCDTCSVLAACKASTSRLSDLFLASKKNSICWSDAERSSCPESHSLYPCVRYSRNILLPSSQSKSGRASASVTASMYLAKSTSHVSTASSCGHR
mmetsp:Transcript_40781/g.86956  ORF Transcript_40781/g.86956 Transcript_40781/m.86956 type:complete len:279 (-) Transcript_40781:551-1387(-)